MHVVQVTSAGKASIIISPSAKKGGGCRCVGPWELFMAGPAGFFQRSNNAVGRTVEDTAELSRLAEFLKKNSTATYLYFQLRNWSHSKVPFHGIRTPNFARRNNCSARACSQTSTLWDMFELNEITKVLLLQPSSSCTHSMTVQRCNTNLCVPTKNLQEKKNPMHQNNASKKLFFWQFSVATSTSHCKRAFGH